MTMTMKMKMTKNKIQNQFLRNYVDRSYKIQLGLKQNCTVAFVKDIFVWIHFMDRAPLRIRPTPVLLKDLY